MCGLAHCPVVITTAGQAAALVLDAYGEGFDQRALHVVDLGPGWRVFHAARRRLGTGELIGAHMASPFPMFVDRRTGEASVECSPRVAGLTAQDACRSMFKDQIGPAVDQLGLRGSGMRYQLPAVDHFCTVGFVGARWSTWAVAEFTGQVSVIPRGAWEAKVANGRARGSEPSADHVDPDRSRGFRSYWTVFAGLPTDEVASEVIGAVRDRALPWIRALLSGRDPAELTDLPPL